MVLMVDDAVRKKSNAEELATRINRRLDAKIVELNRKDKMFTRSIRALEFHQAEVRLARKIYLREYVRNEEEFFDLDMENFFAFMDGEKAKETETHTVELSPNITFTQPASMYEGWRQNNDGSWTWIGIAPKN